MNEQQDKFNFFIPVTFEKAKDKKTGKQKMMIKGIASTTDKDSDDENMNPQGFMLDTFVKSGFFNWHHQYKDNPLAIVGEPTKVEINKSNQMYVEGELYDSPMGKAVYQLGETLEKSGSKRRLGFSIEGKALERDSVNPKRVIKALITGLAITPAPKNSNSIMNIMKGEYDEFYISEYEIEKSDNVDFVIDITNEEGDRITVDKEFKLSVEKANKDTIENTEFTEEQFNKLVVTIVKGYEEKLISEKDFKKAKSEFSKFKKKVIWVKN